MIFLVGPASLAVIEYLTPFLSKAFIIYCEKNPKSARSVIFTLALAFLTLLMVFAMK